MGGEEKKKKKKEGEKTILQAGSKPSVTFGIPNVTKW
jgi:hypothetical protein